VTAGAPVMKVFINTSGVGGLLKRRSTEDGRLLRLRL
jgi:hypothetical protein